MLLGLGLGRAPLLDPDEARHAEIAREMLLSGRWVEPIVNFQPYHHKPSFFYLLVGLAYRVWGVGEVAARSISALSAWMTLLAVYWHGSRVSVGVGLTAALLLGSCAFWVGVGRFTNFDSLATAMLVCAVLCLAGWLEEPAKRGRLVLFHGLLGLAVLAKGPAALVLAAVPVAWALWRGDTSLRRLWSPAGAAVFVCIVAAWTVPTALFAPDYLFDFLWIHNLQRYLVPTRSFHSEPALFFLPVVAGTLLPWSPLVPSALRWALRARASDRLLAVYALWVVVFFSLSAGKLATYVLPAFPVLALLVARWAASAGADGPTMGMTRMLRLMVRAGAWLTLPLPIGAWIALNLKAPGDEWVACVFVPAALAGIVLLVFRVDRRAPLTALRLLCAGMTASIVFFNLTAGAALGRFASDRDLAHLARATYPDRPVVAVGVKPYSFLFYSTKPVVYGADDSAWVRVLASGAPVLVLTKEQRVDRIAQALPLLRAREIGRNPRHILLAIP